MIESSILNQEKFWQVLKYLLSLKEPKAINEICESLELTKSELHSFINFLSEMKCEFCLEKKSKQEYLQLVGELPKITLDFSLFEWLEFQAHFPALSSLNQSPFHEDISEKLGKVEQENKELDLFNHVETLERILSDSRKLTLVDHDKDILPVIESAILSGVVLEIEVDQKKCTVFPRKIVYFDGHFNLFGESLSDKSLINIDLSQVKDIQKTDIHWKEVFSKFELNGFISSLRQMTETGTRLVLKIYSYDKFSSKIDYQYFENPCIFSNADGDYIWAATIEQNSEIFEWIYQLGSDVEILDPKDFKREFLNYCETKLKKLA